MVAFRLFVVVGEFRRGGLAYAWGSVIAINFAHGLYWNSNLNLHLNLIKSWFTLV